MCQPIKNLLLSEHRPGVARRGAALLALLLACSTASSRDPARPDGPYVAADQGLGLNDAAPIAGSSSTNRASTFTILHPTASNARSSTPVDEPRQFDVRAADWNEVTDGSATAADSGTSGASSVLQVAGEHHPFEALIPALAGEFLSDDEQSATAETATEVALPPGFNETGPEQRLSQLEWHDSAGQIDPGQTLQDWAENAGLLVGFGVVSLWLVRQWLGKRNSEGGPTTHLRTIESLSLPQRCRVHLVEVQGHQVLVATDAAGVKSVTVLPDRFAALMDNSIGEAESASAARPDGDRTESDRSGNRSTLRESRPV